MNKWDGFERRIEKQLYNAGIDERLTNIESVLSSVHSCVMGEGNEPGLKTMLPELIKSVSNLVKVIEGNNGSPGLKVQVDRNTQFRERFEKKSSSWNALLPNLVSGALGGVLVGLALYFTVGGK